jgi:hypothetical protein
MISGLAPGKDADTEIVGKSTCGNGDTGSTLKAARPESTTAAVSSVVAMGRWMKGVEKFMGGYACGAGGADRAALRPRHAASLSARPSKNR